MSYYDVDDDDYNDDRAEQARISQFYRDLRSKGYSGDPTVDVPDDWEETLSEIEEDS